MSSASSGELSQLMRMPCPVAPRISGARKSRIKFTCAPQIRACAAVGLACWPGGGVRLDFFSQRFITASRALIVPSVTTAVCTPASPAPCRSLWTVQCVPAKVRCSDFARASASSASGGDTTPLLPAPRPSGSSLAGGGRSGGGWEGLDGVVSSRVGSRPSQPGRVRCSGRGWKSSRHDLSESFHAASASADAPLLPGAPAAAHLARSLYSWWLGCSSEMSSSHLGGGWLAGGWAEMRPLNVFEALALSPGAAAGPLSGFSAEGDPEAEGSWTAAALDAGGGGGGGAESRDDKKP
mmetsp:Transcript_14783/g.44415  ORF Transcript_14783/g.44415 Transcript_14783/m.44415 type:complete len:295 (-) Transcript_14783:407-1291(-)